MSDQAHANTDRELWRAPKGGLPSDYYADSVYVTEQGLIGFNVGGYCVAKTPREWLDLAWPPCAECGHRSVEGGGIAEEIAAPSHAPWCETGERRKLADELFPA